MISKNQTYARMPGRRGFTLVELLVALFIGVLLSTFAVMGFRLYQREMPVEHGAGRLASVFSTARSFAVAQNSIFAVGIDRVHKNFWIDELNTSGAIIVPKVLGPDVLDRNVEFDSILFDGTPYVGDVATIRFYPDGSSEQLTVYLKLLGVDAANANNIFTVKVYGPTGQSKVFKHQRL